MSKPERRNADRKATDPARNPAVPLAVRNPGLAAALARLSPEQRARLSRAGAEAIVAAIDALVAATRTQAELAGVPYDVAARTIRSRAEREGIAFQDAAEAWGKELRQERSCGTEFATP